MFGEGGTAPIGGVTVEEAQAVGAIISEAAVGQNRPVTVLLGRQSLAEAPGTVVDAALVLHDRIADVRFLSMLRRGNVHGALDLGLAPGLLPGRVGLDEGRSRFADAWPTTPARRGRDALASLQAAADGEVDVLVLLGADVLADVPDHDLARRGLEGAGTVIALDLFATPTVAAADVVLPATAPTETDGTVTTSRVG
jgi:NADH-quinone oxidoreductase subunit G